jgi:hypothetical protein
MRVLDRPSVILKKKRSVDTVWLMVDTPTPLVGSSALSKRHLRRRLVKVRAVLSS